MSTSTSNQVREVSFTLQQNPMLENMDVNMTLKVFERQYE